jgi:hypothetical protein
LAQLKVIARGDLMAGDAITLQQNKDPRSLATGPSRSEKYVYCAIVQLVVVFFGLARLDCGTCL